MIDIQRFADEGGQTEYGPLWFYFYDDTNTGGYYGFIPSGASISHASNQIVYTTNDGGTTTIQVYGVSVVSGDDTAATATLTGSSTIDSVTVTGTAASGLTLTISGTAYTVGQNGKLVVALPDFGLMTRADKIKLNNIDTTTLLTKTEASSTYVTKALAITSGEMTANGFVLKNALGNGVVTIPAQA